MLGKILNKCLAFFRTDSTIVRANFLQLSLQKMTPEITSLERFRSHFYKVDILISVGCKLFFQKHKLLHTMAQKNLFSWLLLLFKFRIK